MHKMADLAYLRDGIRRIETSEVRAGSHAAGIFGRCAAAFETDIRAWFTRLLRSCELEYERDIKAHCKGVTLDKTTLGNLIAGVERAAALKPECIGSCIPSSNGIASFLDKLRGINDDWVRMKHHKEVGIPTILDRMKSMETILAVVMAEPESRGDA